MPIRTPKSGGAGRSAKSALLPGEGWLRAAFDQAAVGLSVTNIDGVCVEANPRLCEILGYSLEELRGVSLLDLTHPDDVAKTLQQVRRLRAGKADHYELEKRYVRKDGSTVWARTTVNQLHAVDVKFDAYVGIVEDITESKRAAEALQERTRMLELLNDTYKSISAELDLPMLVQTVTDAATELAGAKYGAFFYCMKDEHGGEVLELYALCGAPREAFERLGLPRNTPIFARTLSQKSVLRSDDITKDPGYGTLPPHFGMPKGHLPVRSYLAAPVASRTGEAIGGLFFGHPQPGVFDERDERLIMGIAGQAAIAIDNARLYEAAQREIANRELAEAALRDTDRRKDEFLATLAHELRNPLAPIRQAAQISKTPNATEAQIRWSHDVISRQVDHMALLLDDLLDISRITRGTLELRLEMTDLASVVAAAVETARPLIDAKRQIFTAEVPSEAVSFAADPLRLAQVLSNLLTNASKYTDPGGLIRLKASSTEDEVLLSVVDSGIGIPQEAISEVFVMFSQVKSSQEKAEGGLGIGLALAKGLVELHGGEISVHSEGPGFGSEFTVRLPRRELKSSREPPAEEPHAARTTRRRVLIADDNRDAAESLGILLEMEGHKVVLAHDGKQALDTFEHEHPDVMLLDIGMPEMNGYEVARRVRQDPAGRDCTLVAVTGWGQDSDRARAVEAGFDYHFTKPVEPRRLVDLLRGELRHH
jgi:PAS domain S-box-containing protein